MGYFAFITPQALIRQVQEFHERTGRRLVCHDDASARSLGFATEDGIDSFVINLRDLLKTPETSWLKIFATVEGRQDMADRINRGEMCYEEGRTTPLLVPIFKEPTRSVLDRLLDDDEL